VSALIDDQPTDVRALTNAERDALIISAVCVDGTWRILSRYGDMIWDVPGVTTNQAASITKHDFKRAPTAFIEVLKAIMYRYLRRGRFGTSAASGRQFGSMFTHLISFLRFLEKMKQDRLSAATPMLCSMYVHECRAASGPSGKPLSAAYLSSKFQAVEALFELSRFTTDAMPSFPWPADTAWSLAGLSGQQDGSRRLQGGRTPLIPDAEFSALFQAAWNVIERANTIMDLRDSVAQIGAEPSLSRHQIWTAKGDFLANAGWTGGLSTLNTCLTDIRTACYIVVASLSGCRNHELAYVQSNACYRTIDDDGEEFWWMRSRSTKTDEGQTEWMIPAAAAAALKVMDRWSVPHNQELLAEIDRRRIENPADIEIARALLHVGAIFLGRDPKGPKGFHQVRTLSDRSWNTLLRSFAKRHGVHWRIATHQFRRTFANYAARSQFGDLRYLKEHFKHWSFDMTLGYAMNEFQEVALYSEIYDELSDLKEGVVSDWMSHTEALAGGLGNRVMEWRGSNDVALFKDHKSMVRTLAEGFGNLRSNGHAWCTADQGMDCVGNGGLDRTRCTGCDHAVIGRIHARVYQGLYDQLRETLKCDDIGEGGRAYVQRSMDRCMSVLKALGHEPTKEMES
jgi:hypothetical protein